jgi:phosphoglucosamine mutase
VGQALPHVLKKPGRGTRIVIGKDTRISGDMLENAMKAGMMSMGADVWSVGVLPTPGIAYVCRQQGSDAGVVISASHNPYEDNGIKIFSGEGFKLTDDQEAGIENLINQGRLPDMVPHPQKMGRCSTMADARELYIAFLKGTIPQDITLAGLKIVMDTANGATYEVAPRVLGDLGADLKVIHNNPDGFNINDRCGSQYTQDLEKQVVEFGADVGLAFDGDGDRLVAVDEKGRVLTGDQILIICARMLKDLGRLKQDLVVSTVMSNLGLRLACKKYGFRHHTSRVGDRHVLEDMKRLGAVIGGEDSGHMIFLEHHTTGDGIIAALQLMVAMIREARPLSELSAMMERYPQKLINVKVQSKPEISSVPRVAEVIQKIEMALGEEGRVLVRYSGTQDLCRVMVEGPTAELTEKYCLQIANVIRAALS